MIRPLVAAVTSMPAVKQMQQRAEKQQHVRQGTQQVRPMFSPEEEGRNSNEP